MIYQRLNTTYAVKAPRKAIRDTQYAIRNTRYAIRNTKLMFDFFEQPWTLIGAAVMALFGVFTYRSVVPEKQNRRQWLLPLAVLVLAFGLDYIVKTDREKVNGLVNTIAAAFEAEDSAAIQAVIADDYSDSFHSNRAELMAHCRRILPGLHLEKVTVTSRRLQISAPTARATVFATATFGQESWVTQGYKSFLFFKGDLHFHKQPDKSWRITEIIPREIDKQPITWRQIRP